MKILITTFLVFIGFSLHAQDSSDADRLKALKYMENVDRIDCNNKLGTTLEDRVCLNLEFQELDSIMNIKFVELLKITPNDSIREQFVTYQKAWVLNRRAQSELASEGYRGHMLGIIYLATMVETTRGRINEIELILGN